ncbi:hypothetical protein FPV67DRAFT_1676312 [Lyophyllum atratum]|nr:hypothetical protein FPV67DRAFT_1676312 [Lyophyllum atratum]
MSSLLVLIINVDGLPDWQSVRVVIQRHTLITQTLVYTTQSPASSAKLRIVLFCSCGVGASKMIVDPPIIYQDVVAAFRGGSTEHRLYEPFLPAHGISTLDPLATVDLPPDHILVMNAMTPTPSAEETFNDWYFDEHIPLLRRVPFWISSERFKLASSTSDASPQYLALHRWSDAGAFDSAEYIAATNTPWRTAVIAEIIKKERLVLVYEGSLDDLAT